MKFETLTRILSGVAAAGVMSLAQADTLELRDGRTVDGVMIGATGDTLYLRADGQVRLINIDEVASIRFDPRPMARSESGSTEPAHERAVIVAAGASMMVALPDDLVRGNPVSGDRFTASLSEDFKSGDVVVAAAGSRVYGEVVPGAPGGLAMVLTDLTVEGSRLPIKTKSRPMPANGDPAGIEFLVERPFTLRLASN